ncbi:hypothetical protein NA56DRAFT_756854 [Hyaloscypha hepaticicola]|uniref:Uncharacterized protein n=1 Tax=Hyaloscypha hepaticicola TaxID=2082293 RepID=A0A2J6PDN6_9HELO|nr:hypothetical protein NA56DRAFT_756854 [Hyaloscypha hepaticicola]
MTMNMSESSKLLTAASHGEWKDVEKLLNDGEDLNVTDPEGNGNTALHIAAEKGHWKFVETLLKKGADTIISNKVGFTARDLAERMIYIDPNRAERYQKVIELLDDPPVYVKEEKLASTQIIQTVPSEGNRDRERICQYFKGHILHWFENLSKEADYSVDGIIYKDVLTTSVKKLQTKFDEREQRVKKEEVVKTKGPEKSRKEADAEKEKDKKDKKKQKSDEPTGVSTGVLKDGSQDGPDILKKANTWIHLPANNLYWVEHLVEKLCADDKATETDCKEIMDFINDSFFEHGRKNSGSCFRQPLLYTHPLKPHLMSFVIPFIDADSAVLFNKEYVVSPVDAINNPPPDFEKTKSKKDYKDYELRTRCSFMQKLKTDPIYRGRLHVARTLVQSYFDEGNDESTDQRVKSMDKPEDDQVITRYIKNEMEKNSKQRAKDSKEGGKEGATEIPILVVKQLWLWTVNKRTIITASPVRYNKTNQFTLQNHITKDLAKLCSNYSLEDFVKHIVSRTVEFIEDPCKAGLESPCFDVYSSEIAALSNQVSDRYNDFRESIERKKSWSKVHTNQRILKEYTILVKIRTIIDEINILQPIFDEQHSMTRRLLKWVDSKTVDNKNGNTLLLGIRTILGEINDLQPGLGEDESMPAKLLKWLESKMVDNGSGSIPNRGKGLKKWEDFAVSDQTEILKQRVQWLEKDAQRVLTSIDTLLNLKQKQASIDSADSAEYQGNVVLAFTTVTIIFAPLTFMVALFTIPHDGVRIQWQGGRSVGYMAAAEFATLFVVSLGVLVANPDLLKEVPNLFRRTSSPGSTSESTISVVEGYPIYKENYIRKLLPATAEGIRVLRQATQRPRRNGSGDWEHQSVEKSIFDTV